MIPVPQFRKIVVFQLVRISGIGSGYRPEPHYSGSRSLALGAVVNAAGEFEAPPSSGSSEKVYVPPSACLTVHHYECGVNGICPIHFFLFILRRKLCEKILVHRFRCNKSCPT